MAHKKVNGYADWGGWILSISQHYFKDHIFSYEKHVHQPDFYTTT